MNVLAEEYRELKRQIFDFYDVIKHHVVNETMKDGLEERKDKVDPEPKNIEALYYGFKDLTNLFEYMQIMKNNEKYVQESAGASPSVYAINTNMLQMLSDQFAHILFKHLITVKEKDIKKPDAVLKACLSLKSLKSDGVNEVLHDLLPGSHTNLGKKNLSLLQLSYTPIPESSVPKNAMKVRLEVMNTTHIVYDFDSLVDHEKVEGFGSTTKEGVNQKLIDRFNNFHVYKDVERDDVLTINTIESLDKDLFLLVGELDGVTYFRKIVDRPEWDTVSNSNYLPVNMFKCNMENKLFMMYKNNIKRSEIERWMDSKFGVIKGSVKRDTRMSIPDIVFNIAKEDVEDESQLLNLISVVAQMNSDKTISDKGRYMSDRRNFKALASVFQ
jgi:hypothetical protein